MQEQALKEDPSDHVETSADDSGKPSGVMMTSSINGGGGYGDWVLW